jgi:hypothetical protein
MVLSQWIGVLPSFPYPVEGAGSLLETWGLGSASASPLLYRQEHKHAPIVRAQFCTGVFHMNFDGVLRDMQTGRQQPAATWEYRTAFADS